MPTSSNGSGPRHVAIIGAGYAGTAAALELSKADANIRVSILESAKVAGGRARAVQFRGHTLDNGQHMLIGAYTTLLDLMRTVGVPESHVLRMPMRMRMYPDFELVTPGLPAPLHLGWGLLTARGLTWADKVAALRLTRLVQLKSLPAALQNATVLTLLQHTRQTPRLVQTLWMPLCIAALNTPVESASANVFANVMRDALFRDRHHSDFLLPTVSLTALFPGPALEWLRSHGAAVRLGTRVRAIRQTAGGFSLDVDGDGAVPLDCDAVISAVGPHQLEALGGEAGRSIAARRPARYEPIFTIYLCYEVKVRMPAVMIGRQSGMVQWFFDREALGGPTGLVAAIVSATGEHEAQPLAEVAQRAHLELEEIVGPLAPPLWSKVIAERFATFACTPDAQRPQTLTAVAGLFLAGDFVDGPYPGTLEGAVRSGVSAASCALDYLRS